MTKEAPAAPDLDPHLGTRELVRQRVASLIADSEVVRETIRTRKRLNEGAAPIPPLLKVDDTILLHDIIARNGFQRVLNSLADMALHVSFDLGWLADEVNVYSTAEAEDLINLTFSWHNFNADLKSIYAPSVPTRTPITSEDPKSEACRAITGTALDQWPEYLAPS